MYHSFMQIKVLLLAVKDFDPDCGDSAYTVGIVDLLLKCVELSYKAGNSLISSFVNKSKKKKKTNEEEWMRLP